MSKKGAYENHIKLNLCSLREHNHTTIKNLFWNENTTIKTYFGIELKII